ncbi:hypothetical protein QIS99_05205 [Streptomyces sp. B-S-A8]|uniref:Transmembrane protein n=1 Tax=Streptomyces solicavernae TaxID=3043614 RepID=A0ABT6RPI1_9ACTN|nr:hypothetical protein [Streptomyces sp. B-S-A8]MDI3385616.1 hypothetical protein [Streptomyces sp. B-S-A8]
MGSRDYDLDYRDRANRIRKWGTFLLTVATLQWLWCAVLLVLPYEIEDGPNDASPKECESRLLTDSGTANEGAVLSGPCENERDWPEAVAVLALSVPVSVAGAVLFTTGSVRGQISAHAWAMRELDRPA